jgi:prepilin-type N-terminal cleavage/methylation domain-containing protein
MKRGFTLIEIMIAVGLAGIASAFLLLITRSQLMAYQMNENLTDAQLNARAGIDFLETTLRKACGGVTYGMVSVNVNNVTLAANSNPFPCVRVNDGVEGSGSPTITFNAAAPTTASDSLDLIYGSAPVSIADQTTVNVGGGGSVIVCDGIGSYNQNDLVLVGDLQQAFLLRLSAAPAAAVFTPNPASCPRSAKLSFDAAAAPTPLPTVVPNPPSNPTPPAPLNLPPLVTSYTGTRPIYVMKATSVTIYRYLPGVNQYGMLMVRPGGIANVPAIDGPDQPLVEGVDNFEVALAADANNDGIINETLPPPTQTTGSDEWIGNAINELTQWPNNAFVNLPSPGTGLAPPLPQYKQIRATLLTRTTNTYTGSAMAVSTPVEDRTNSWNTTTATNAPRYRTMRVTVAPRVWNLLN